MTDTPIERIARALPRQYPGPGGAAAVLRFPIQFQARI